MKNHKAGIYETNYGNAVSYEPSESVDYGYDLDMCEEIPMEMIDFTKYLGDIQ